MAYAHYHNEDRLNTSTRSTAAACVERLSKWRNAVDEIHGWPEYKPQPLWSLPKLAQQVGVKQIYLKDESMRFGQELGSFKALGAPYAVFKVLGNEVRRQVGVYPTSEELRSGKYRTVTEQVTVCVATDGNQGRGLAYGAKTFGCRCVDYIHNHVSEGRAKAMRNLGAIVIRIDGEYEASVDRAKEDARMNGWYFISSTSWGDFDESVPQNVMNAYMVVVDEALSMLPVVEKITHVFVCGGVGSIAAMVFVGFWLHYQNNKGSFGPDKLPRFIVVEPTEADCLFQSAKRKELCPSEGSLRTIMAGLACRKPSPAAMKILSWLASDFVKVSDSIAVEGMRALAHGLEGDVPIVCGESSAASMGLLLKAISHTSIRDDLGLDKDSQVIVFGLEGATDPGIFEELVGKTPSNVFHAQAIFNSRAP